MSALPEHARATLRNVTERTADLAERLSPDRRRASDHRCASCGYQISVPKPHPGCPMCGSNEWVLIATGRQAVIEQR
jgi:rubrerythrin